MRNISYRNRTLGDDIRSIRGLPSATVVDGDKVTIPRAPTNPIVVWGGDLSTRVGSDVIESYLQWPLACEKRCHNCSHYFDGVPVPLPVRKDERRKIYFCEGKFCSWQCAKSFNMRETSPAGRGSRNMYIAILAYKTWIKHLTRHVDATTLQKMRTYCNYRLDPAPPKSNLIEFGGKLTIEEYRKDFCGIHPPLDAINETDPCLNIRRMATLPFIDTEATVPRIGKTHSGHTEHTAATIGTKRIQTDRVQEFNNSFVDRLKKARLDPDLMTRKKEADVSNTLVASMGIEIKKRAR